MAGKNGKSDFNPEKKPDNVDKLEDKGKDFANKMLGGIDKAISKDKREELKDDVKEHKVLPASPFSDISSLPTLDHEERYKEQIESSEEEAKEPEKPIEASGGDEQDGIVQEPINPFEALSPKAPVIEKKALDDKPLDRPKASIDQELDSDEIEGDPEEIGHTKEQMNEKNTFEENLGKDDNEIKVKEVSEATVGEVILPKNEEEELPGHVDAVAVESAREDFKEEFWDILEQSGITKRKLGYILLLIFIGVVVVVAIFSGGLSFFDNDVKVERNSEEEVGKESDEKVGEGESQAYEIISSYIFGLEFTTPSTPIEAVPIGEKGNLSGIEASFIFGGITESFESMIVYYMDILRRMDSIYQTEVYSLIDMAVDRRLALDKHIREMADLISEAETAFAAINAAIISFDAEFGKVVTERDIYEDQFFIATDELLGQSTYEYLSLFIEKSKSALEIKAYYNSYKSIRDLYVRYLDILKPRYKDIVSNTEAIIKGIKFFDIPASDIDAIIRLE